MNEWCTVVAIYALQEPGRGDLGGTKHSTYPKDASAKSIAPFLQGAEPHGHAALQGLFPQAQKISWCRYEARGGTAGDAGIPAMRPC